MDHDDQLNVYEISNRVKNIYLISEICFPFQQERCIRTITLWMQHTRTWSVSLDNGCDLQQNMMVAGS